MRKEETKEGCYISRTGVGIGGGVRSGSADVGGPGSGPGGYGATNKQGTYIRPSRCCAYLTTHAGNKQVVNMTDGTASGRFDAARSLTISTESKHHALHIRLTCRCGGGPMELYHNRRTKDIRACVVLFGAYARPNNAIEFGGAWCKHARGFMP